VAAFTALAIISLVGMGISAYAQWKAGKKAEEAAKAEGAHQQEASNSQADLADDNAAIADLQGQDAIERGAVEESRFRTQVRGIIGTARTEIAANNIDVSYGSAVDVQADAAYLGELDALQLRNNAKGEAWGFEMQADDLRKRAIIARKEGTYQAAAGNAYESGKGLQLASNLIGGSASLLQMKYGFDRTKR
jgi:hypothetical protein